MGSWRLNGLRRMAVFVVILVSFTGCMSHQILPSQDSKYPTQSFEVVAMEPPPLIVTSGYLNPGFIGAYGPGTAGLALVYGVIVMIIGPNDNRESIRASKKYLEMLSSNGIWIPTVILANKAVETLESMGKGKITLRPGYVKMPNITDREQTIFMENWYSPIRAWYNANPSLLQYDRQDERVQNLILEVGIISYEVYGDNLMLTVMTKIVDPRDGHVSGRVRSSGMVYIGSTKDLFIDDARKFKDVFSRLGFRLLNECLIKLSLVH
jgi:hypothetical protein